MRPTEIGLKIPKDYTPGPYTTSITHDGGSLLGSSQGNSPMILQARRFAHYTSEATKTGYRVGPGSYNIDRFAMGKAIGLKTPLYKSLHGVKEDNNYYMAGNHLVPYKQERRLSLADSAIRTEFQRNVMNRSTISPIRSSTFCRKKTPIAQSKAFSRIKISRRRRIKKKIIN